VGARIFLRKNIGRLDFRPEDKRGRSVSNREALRKRLNEKDGRTPAREMPEETAGIGRIMNHARTAIRTGLPLPTLRHQLRREDSAT